MNVPVVTIQIGNQQYYSTVIKQAKKYNKDVFAIGDCLPPSNQNINNFMQRADEFSSVYEHLSTNSKKIELMCFNRWFILLDFMKKNGLDVCFHIDSDVMLYVDVGSLWKRYDQFDFTLTHRCCGSSSYFTQKGLEEFCNYLMNFYKNKNTYDYERVTAHYYIRQKHGLPGGVCDMTLLQNYSYLNCGKIGEMMHINDFAVFDHNINEPDQNFRMRNGIKDIAFHAEIPFCIQQTTAKQIQFWSLHFQGPAKRYISQFTKV